MDGCFIRHSEPFEKIVLAGRGVSLVYLGLCQHKTKRLTRSFYKLTIPEHGVRVNRPGVFACPSDRGNL